MFGPVFFTRFYAPLFFCRGRLELGRVWRTYAKHSLVIGAAEAVAR